MLDVRRLRLLREFQLRGTLADVARALSYSPSLISQQMAILEREAGTPLLRRAGRRVQLTPQGEFLARRAGEILDQLERTEAELAVFNGEINGVVRLAVFQSVAHSVIPLALHGLEREHPQLRVEFVEREPEAGLFETTTRDFDLVVAEEYPGTKRLQRPELDHQVLGSDFLRFVTPPENTWRVDSFARANEVPWTAEPRGTATREWLTQMCRAAGFEPDVRYETPDLVTQLRLVESGRAVAVLPDLFLASTSSPVRRRALPNQARREVFTAARTATATSPGIMAVRSALVTAFQIVARSFPGAGDVG